MSRSNKEPPVLPVLLESKLFVPRLRPGHVARPRLVARARRGLDLRLTSIEAPAGYGKTSLVAELFRTMKRPGGFVALDAGDNLGTRFWSYVGLALQRLYPGLGGSATSALQGPSPPAIETILTLWINELSRQSSASVLALDDLHTIAEPSIHQQLCFFAEHLPPSLHLILASRGALPFSLARMRSAGELAEFAQQDLRFSEEESVSYFGAVGGAGAGAGVVELPEEHVWQLHERTEGWVAGLQLASVSLAKRRRSEQPFDGFVGEFGGTHRSVSEFLHAEVFAGLTTQRRRLLVRLSVLDRFDAALCEAVTGQPQAQAILERIDRDRLPVVPLDDENRWFRFHHLFAEFLRRRLQTDYPQDMTDSHQRASRWFARQGDWEQAFEHALATDDHRQALDYFERGAPLWINHGQLLTVLRNAERLGVELQDLGADLLIQMCWAHFMSNQEAECRRLLHLVQGRDHLTAAQEAMLLTLLGSIERRHSRFDQAQALLERAWSLAPETDHRLRAEIALQISLTLIFTSQLEAAARYCQLGLEEVGNDQQLPVLGIALQSNLAQVLCIQGRLRAAERLCRQAAAGIEGASIEGAETLEETDPPVFMAMIFRNLGRIHVERGEWSEALQQLGAALRMARSGGIDELCALILLWLAEVERCLGDQPACDAWLAQIDEIDRRRPLPELERGWLSAMRTHGYLLRGDLSTAEKELAPWSSQLDSPPSMIDEHLRCAELHLLASRGERRQALEHVERYLASARQSDSREFELELLVWRSWLEDEATSLDTLKEALALAWLEGHVRPFVSIDPELCIRRLRRLTKRQDLESHALQHGQKVLAVLTDLASERGRVQAESGAAEVCPLTRRELEVLQWLADGSTNQEVSERLGVALTTIKTHVKNSFRKLSVKRRTQAIAKARQHGWLQ